MIKAKFSFFQMQQKSVSSNLFELNQGMFGITPKRFYS